MQLVKPFLGVPDGAIYPVQYQPGDECPLELEAAATELGAFSDVASEAEGEPAKSPRAKK
ncbi:hypothetical protein IFT74_15395 [Oxalobacteraceae sp. CFBP 8755]|nr:hypothetical protein [Oxalobacteraceae sp. CFBP 8755]